MTAPYEERDGWELNVMLIDGTMYLEEHHSHERLRQKYVTTYSLCIVSYPVDMVSNLIRGTGTQWTRANAFKHTTASTLR